MPPSQGENRDKNPEKIAAVEKSKQTLKRETVKTYGYPIPDPVVITMSLPLRNAPCAKVIIITNNLIRMI
jgi:hypothetical protein